MKLLKLFIYIYHYFFLSFSNREIVKEIKIDGNERITDETNINVFRY